MNKNIVLVPIVLMLLFCLSGTSCKYEYEPPQSIIVINETANYLCVLSNTFWDGDPKIWEGGKYIDFLKPHDKCWVEYIDTEKDMNRSVIVKIIFMEAVNPDNYVKSRADTSNVKSITKFYTLPELQAMDWTIVYDGNME